MKKKTLKKELKETREFLTESGKREDRAHLEVSKMFKTCREQQMEIKHLEEKLRFYRNR